MDKKLNRMDAKRIRRSPEAMEIAMLAAGLKSANPDDDHPKLVDRAMRLWVEADKFIAEKERESEVRNCHRQKGTRKA